MARRGAPVHRSAMTYARERMAATRSSIYLGEGSKGWALVETERSALILGPPRSGKTTSTVTPSVAAAPGAVVSTSTKPDVLMATAGARSQLGRCWLFDPTGGGAAGVRGLSGLPVSELPLSELRWSAPARAGNWEAAVSLAHSMVSVTSPRPTGSDSYHWYERAEALMAPLLHAAALTGEDMAAVVRWINRRDVQDAVRVLDQHGANLALDVLDGIMETEARGRSGIFSTASGTLSAYRAGPALAAAAHPHFEPDSFVHSQDTLYICFGGAEQDRMAPLVAALLEAVRQAAYKRASS